MDYKHNIRNMSVIAHVDHGAALLLRSPRNTLRNAPALPTCMAVNSLHYSMCMCAWLLTACCCSSRQVNPHRFACGGRWYHSHGERAPHSTCLLCL